MPMVVTGLSPLDVLVGIRRRSASSRRAEPSSRTPTRGRSLPTGTPWRGRVVEACSVCDDRAWRGIGVIPSAASVPAAPD